MKTLFKIIGVIILLAIVGGGVVGYLTYKNSGENAIEKMSDSEKEILAKVVTIPKGMSYAEVVEILGEPSDLADTTAPLWTVNDEPQNRLVVIFGHSGVTSVQWAKAGSFYYEHDGVIADGEEGEKPSKPSKPKAKAPEAPKVTE